MCPALVTGLAGGFKQPQRTGDAASHGFQSLITQLCSGHTVGLPRWLVSSCGVPSGAGVPGEEGGRRGLSGEGACEQKPGRPHLQTGSLCLI